MTHTKFILTAEDKSSSLWKRLRDQLEQRLSELRAKNDGALDANDTAKLRGQIAEVKRLLSLEKDLPSLE